MVGYFIIALLKIYC